MTKSLKQPLVRFSPSKGTGSPDVWGIYEPDSGSVQYICADPASKQAALIDVVWNFDPKSYSTSFKSADQVLGIVEQNGLEVVWVLDTHPHADHLMASAYLKQRTGAPSAIGERVNEIAELWSDIYHLTEAFSPKRDFDRLFREGEAFKAGNLDAKILLTPGHTLGSVTYLVGDAAFVNDTLMHPDVGTSRADFPGGDAAQLWDTIQALFRLPEKTRLFVGHDYGSSSRQEPRWEATVAEHKMQNVHVKDGTRREDWLQRRIDRDATLPLPDRMLAALQINLRGGRLPPAEGDDRHYLKIPVNRFSAAKG